MPIYTTPITIDLPLAGLTHFSVTYEYEKGYPSTWWEPGEPDWSGFISATLDLGRLSIPLPLLPEKWQDRLLSAALDAELAKAAYDEPMDGWDADSDLPY
jgi:hypothetical protein